MSGQQRVPRDRTGDFGRRAVENLDQQLQFGQAILHALDAVAQAGVEHDRFAVGVLEQVVEFVVEVPVVHVHRSDPRLERRVLRDQVLGAVVHEHADLRAQTHALGSVGRGHPGRLVVVLRPGDLSITVGDRGRRRHGVGMGLEDVGKRQHGGSPGCGLRRAE